MYRTRLHRLPWLYTTSPVYFVTTCTYNQAGLLDTASIHESFLLFCRRATERHVFVGRYVIMQDHLHLFVAFAPGSTSLSEWLKSLKNHLSRALRDNGRPSPHWQKGFFDHVLRSQVSYSEKWAYVLLNPVRAGLVAHSEDWPVRERFTNYDHCGADLCPPPFEASALIERRYR